MRLVPVNYDPTKVDHIPDTETIETDSKPLNLVPVDYDPTQANTAPEEPALNPAVAMGKGIKSGLLDIASGIGTGTQYLGGRVGSETLQTLGKEASEYWKPEDVPESIRASVLENPELLKDPTWWAYNLGRGSMSMVPSIAAGIAGGSVTGAIAGGLIGGAQEGVSTYQEILERGGTEQQAARGMEAMTTGSALLNTISLGKMLKPGKLASLRRILTAAATEAGTEYMEEPVEVLIKRGLLTEDMFTSKEAFEQLKQGVNVIPIAFGLGGLGSTAGGIGNRVVQSDAEKRVEKVTPPITSDMTPGEVKAQTAENKALVDMVKQQEQQVADAAVKAKENEAEGTDLLVIPKEETSTAPEPGLTIKTADEVAREQDVDIDLAQPVPETQAIPAVQPTAEVEETPAIAQVPVEDAAKVKKAMRTAEEIERELLRWRAYREAGYDMSKLDISEVDAIEASKPLKDQVKINYAILKEIEGEAEENAAVVQTKTDLSDAAIAKTTQDLAKLGIEEISDAASKNIPFEDPTVTLGEVEKSIENIQRIKIGLTENRIGRIEKRQGRRKQRVKVKGLKVETQESVELEDLIREQKEEMSEDRITQEEYGDGREYSVEEPKKYTYGDRVVTLTGQERQRGPFKMLQYFAEYTEEDNLEYEKAWGGKKRPPEDKGQYGWAPEQALKEYKGVREYSVFDKEGDWKQSSESAKKAFDDYMSGVFSVRDNSSASNLLVAAYSYDAPTWKDIVAHLKQIIKAEGIAAKYRDTPRRAWSKKAIARAIERKEIPKEAAKYIDVIFSTLRVQPNMKIETDPNLKAIGLYELANNLMVLKSPKALAHEIMHWAFYNVLTSTERIAYYQDYINTFYKKDGGKKKVKAFRATSRPGNAMRNPSEMFASRGSDIINRYKLTETEKTLFQKTISWFKEVCDRIAQTIGVDLSHMNRYFDKILVSDVTERTEWLENEEDEYRTISEGNIDPYSMPSVAGRARYLSAMYSVAEEPTLGDRMLTALRGKDGKADYESQGVYSLQPDEIMTDRLKAFGAKYLSSPMMFKAGQAIMRHVFNLNRGEQHLAYMYETHSKTLEQAEKGLSSEEKKNVRRVLEGKIEGNEKEKNSASIIRKWLDTMRAKYKLYLLDEYRQGLNKDEYNILLDLIADVPAEQIGAKYPRVKTDVVEEIVQHFNSIDTWGIDDYVPNVERGRYKIVKMVEGEDGKKYKKLVAVGFSKKDAVRKALYYRKQFPDEGDLYIDTSFFEYASDKIKLKPGAYYSMMNKLATWLASDIGAINQEIGGNLNKKAATELAKETMAGSFTLSPTNNFNPFLQPRKDVLKGEEDIFPVLHTYAYNMEKSIILDEIISVIRKDMKNLSPTEQEYILNLMEDVKGRYTIGDKWFDSIFGTYSGYSRLVAKLRTAEAWNKLGYRPVAALINLASGQFHTWIKVGTRYYTKGIQFLRTPEGQKFIDDNKEYLGTTLAVEAGGAKSRTGILHPLGMFQAAEPYNRKVSMAANYVFAKEELGLEHRLAEEYAIQANWVQQFTYNMANLPRFMRGPTGRLLTQFKPYMVKELEFMSTLTGPQWARYACMQLALGGPRGLLMILRSLPILSALGFFTDFTDWIEEWMNKNAPIASRGVAALPSLVKPEWGVDVSAAATFQFPDEWKDLFGPTLSDIASLWKNVLKPMSDYGISEAATTKAFDINPAFKYWKRLMEYAVSDDNWLKDRQGNKLYEITDPYAYIVQNALGVENIDINRVRAEEGILNRRKTRLWGEKTRVINDVVECIKSGTPIPQDLIDRMMKHSVNVKSIKRRLRLAALDPATRAVLETEMSRRPEVLDMYPNVGDHVGILP